MSINRFALLQVEFYIEVPVEWYCIIKDLLRSFNETVDALGNVITFQ